MSKTIVLTAGGSGGHLFPAIALGLALLKRGYPVKLYTDDRGAEYAKLKSCLEAHIGSLAFSSNWR
ncbi:MAG: glycosyltransferase, partial [Rhodospirillaceae bacterium]|nr:glycosyltransferase [Rhodospirillaceae bacterium]